MSNTSTLLPGAAGTVEVSIDLAPEPSSSVKRMALVAHPHPLFGGTKDNKVVQTIARSLQVLGYECWRSNFRGVGASTGEHDKGIGEADDLFALVQAMREQAMGQELELVLAGFSFGSFVQTQVANRLAAIDVPIKQLILVAPAVTRFQLALVRADTLVIHGEIDDVVSLPSVIDWARPQNLPLVVVPGADHFFHRKLTIIKNIIFQHWGRSDLRLPLE